jgi:hypothetical protein
MNNTDRHRHVLAGLVAWCLDPSNMTLEQDYFDNLIEFESLDEAMRAYKTI